MKRTFPIFLVICFALLPPRALAQNSVLKPSPIPAHASYGEKLHLPGVPNFGKINDRLYRGAQPRGEGFAGLQKIGITTIVDLRANGPKIGWEQRHAESAGIHFVHIPVGGWSSPTDKQVAQFLTIFRDEPDARVFVHCLYGDDRTGVFVAAYRMAYDKYLSDEALHEMYLFGFNGMFHPGMAKFVKAFPKLLVTAPPLAVFRTQQ